MDERSQEFAAVNEDRYQEAFKKFEPAPEHDKAMRLALDIVEKHAKENFTPETLKKIYGMIDLAQLDPLTTTDGIWGLADRLANAEGQIPDLPTVAAVCVYPNHVRTLRQALTTEGIRIAAVTGAFPTGQTFTEVKIAETALAREDGAEEIDTVMNLGCLLEEDYEAIADELAEIKSACGDASLKVIIESGALHEPRLIQRAAILAMYSGAEFIKTSTGTTKIGASPDAVYVLCQTIKRYYELTDYRVGLKISGGVRAAEEAVAFYTIVKEVLGEHWLDKTLLRFGASRLNENLLRKLE